MSSTPVDLAQVPMGGTLVPGGASFRVYAPNANAVCVSGDFNSWPENSGVPLEQVGGGHWAAFVPNLKEGDEYRFYVNGRGSQGYKRDPRARELTFTPAFPESNCALRDPSLFPWHNTAFRPPAFNDLVVYQLHVGTFSIASGSPNGCFLDVVSKLPYLASLGINAIEPLPVTESANYPSLGYNGTDLFSPEQDYGLADGAGLAEYFSAVNALLAQRGQSAYSSTAVLSGSANQLRVLVDLCHVYGIAVLFDVVYGHAGGGFDDASLWFMDRMTNGNLNNSLYFTDQAVSAGQAFAYWNNDVKQFLIDNAAMFYREYRVDGFRFDQVSDMDNHGGWATCQDMTDTLHFLQPGGVLISEYWPVDGAVLNPTASGGAGFDATWTDRLRDAVRGAIGQSSGGAAAFVDMDSIAGALQFTPTSERWQCVQYIEDHDILWVGHAWQPRVPALADSINHRSWYARSRSRAATGLVLTAPGIPMIFMGQEFLEEKPWSDNAGVGDNIWWDGVNGADQSMVNHLRFTSDLIALRRRQPALRGEGLNVFYVNDQDRIVAFQRWVEGAGRDVVVVASLNESTYWSYDLGFPGSGQWLEVFNSDVYDNWVNPWVAGNGGAVWANSGGMHGLPASATIVIPANGILVFARDGGEA
ncbi:MAG: alpha amylase C-terminal domain-containing protein [Bryobacteraceae bacterium]